MPNLKPWIEAQLKRGYSKNQIKDHLITKGYPHKVVAEVDKTVGYNKISDKNHPHYFLFIAVVLIIVAAIYIFNIQIEQAAETIPQPPTEIDEQYVQTQSLSGALKGISDTAFILDSDGKTLTVPYNLAEKKFLIFEVQEEELIPISIDDIKLESMITILKEFQDGVEVIDRVVVEVALVEPVIQDQDLEKLPEQTKIGEGGLVDDITLQQVSQDEISVYEIPSTKSCKDFSEVIGEVSCEEALELVLAEYPGEVKYIDKTQIPEAGTLPDSSTFKTEDVWLIGISLENAIETPIGESKNIEVTVNRINKTSRLYKIRE